MTENLQADCVQSRQAGFIQCLLRAIPHKDCATDAKQDIFMITYNIKDVKAIPHKDCATDASSNFSSDETKSGVNTWCIHEHFCEIWESVSYLTYADCVVRFFERWREKRRKSFVDFRVFSRNISENMHARCVREDTKQALKGNLQADGVQSRQTLFVRYCLYNVWQTSANGTCFRRTAQADSADSRFGNKPWKVPTGISSWAMSIR